MKHLYLLRHAKASRGEAETGDYERPLLPQGVQSAQAIGEFMAARRIHPTLVACSSARRARETWQTMAVLLDEPCLTCLELLYAATAATLLQFLRSVPAPIESVLLVGHNPSLQELAVGLVMPGPVSAHDDNLHRLRNKYPTAALAGFTVPLTTWTALAWQACPLDFFVRPTDLLA